MIKQYRDVWRGKSACTQLNEDIENNPGIKFEIVGYQNTMLNLEYNVLVTSILVQWGKNFKESE